MIAVWVGWLFWGWRYLLAMLRLAARWALLRPKRMLEFASILIVLLINII